MLVLAKAIGILVTPPGVIVVLAVFGLLLQLRWRRLGLAVVWVATLSLLILSLPATGYYLMNRLEASVSPLPSEEALRKQVGAIVVLGGGRYREAPEYYGDTVSAATLVRLRYGARLHRTSGVPLLLTGGSVFGEPIAEAELMQRTLVQDFQTRAEWIESDSRTTRENALHTRAILEKAGIRRIALVTHAWHMPRSAWAFERAGLEVIPAATGFTPDHEDAGPLDLLPSIRGLILSSRAASEWIGLLWYRLSSNAN